MTEEKETVATGEKEVVVVGLSNSLKLMTFSAFVFVCMCAFFTSLALTPGVEVSHLILASGAIGITLFISFFMTVPYFTEQSIVYNAMNMHLKTTQSEEIK